MVILNLIIVIQVVGNIILDRIKIRFLAFFKVINYFGNSLDEYAI